MSDDEMITCREAVERLWAYIDGELQSGDERSVEAHLEVCKGCYPHYDFQKAFREFVRKHGHATAPADLRKRIFLRLLLKTDGVLLVFTDDAIEEVATTATSINERTEDIGARRLHTILERVLQEVSFDAPDAARGEVTVDAEYVRERLRELVKDQDLSRFIL